ncbi:DNRLRE domain-containing protein [Streptomyces sp. ISL-44]|uniref:DNRLRE domain-containing protein n=1 Tax=Streptomyces sp. ISL-44 TaxID=2819184 RepID=UPI001BEBF626|nr:DNRLRE domain-containing protein [Streptomyces sp. ISL-44]MBT2545072.1 DNRLRE domain-containing protein [Streptomyces sp. ISL-44]
MRVTGDGKPQAGPVEEAPIAQPEARRLAEASGKQVEVTAARSANTTTWARPDGTYRKQVFNSAVRAQVDGRWKPIDTDLHRVEAGYAAKAVNGRVVFSAGSKQHAAAGGERSSRSVTRVALRQDTPGEVWTELVRLNTDGHDIVVSWPGTLPEPVIDGPRALYENVRPGIDLVMTAQDGGYSHVLVVKDRQAAADPLLGQLKYQLASPDLAFRLDAESGAVSARNAQDEEVAGSPTPMMWDSSGKVATTDNEPAWKPTDKAAEHPTLALAGLAGAEGARLKPAKPALADNVLSLAPDTGLLNAPETVYPVFIDPSFKGHKHAWTLLYKTEGNSSFYNGQNYNASGTNEARVGYESTTGGTSRSIFNFDFGSDLHGADIISASVRALQTYSWSCEQKPMDIYSTPYITSSSTWNNTNNGTYWNRKVATEYAGYGYNSSCPDNWIAPDIKGLVADAAASGWGALSLGFAAPNESDSWYWKKFLANGETAPYIDIAYNHPPDTPTAANMQTFPGGPCLTTSPGTGIGKTNVTFQSKGSDRDGLETLKEVQIEIWDAATGAQIYNEWLPPNSDGVVTHEVPFDKFTDGKKYHWLSRVRDRDLRVSGSGPNDSGGGGWCTFTVSHIVPPSPTISSTDFPGPGGNYTEWSAKPAGTPNQVIKVYGSSYKAEDIREYQWSLNRPLFDQKIAPSNGDEASIPLQVDTAGPNTLYVRTVNRYGNISDQKTYEFLVSPRDGLDKPGDATGDGHPDLFAIDKDGNLRSYGGDAVGDTDVYIPGAVQDGVPVAAGYWKTDANGKRALIGHSTDWFPGDGLTDLIARMPDGKLYVYPGIGTGQFDVARRMEILLPPGAPDPATFRQIIVTEDVDGDGLADMFALDADSLWSFSGYTGSSFTSHTKMAGVVWAPRDLIGVRDVSGDKVPDLLFRDNANASRGILLRKGKPGANGGVDLASLAASANAVGGVDYTYATTGWGRTTIPMLLGTPDATGDGIPDIWAVDTLGNQWLYQGGTAALGAASGRDEDGWNTFLAIG